EGLPVVPFDALAQRQGQLPTVLAPRPARRQVRHDRLQAGLRDILLVHDEVVEDAHRRLQCRARRFFEDRHRGRAVEMREAQRAARLLRHCWPPDTQREYHRGSKSKPRQMTQHIVILPVQIYRSNQTSSNREPLYMLLTWL